MQYYLIYVGEEVYSIKITVSPFDTNCETNLYVNPG